MPKKSNLNYNNRQTYANVFFFKFQHLTYFGGDIEYRKMSDFIKIRIYIYIYIYIYLYIFIHIRWAFIILSEKNEIFLSEVSISDFLPDVCLGKWLLFIRFFAVLFTTDRKYSRSVNYSHQIACSSLTVLFVQQISNSIVLVIRIV